MNKYLRAANRIFWATVIVALLWGTVALAAYGAICLLTHGGVS